LSLRDIRRGWGQHEQGFRKRTGRRQPSSTCPIGRCPSIQTSSRIRHGPRSIPLLPKHACYTPLPRLRPSGHRSAPRHARSDTGVRGVRARKLVPASGDTSEVRFDGILGICCFSKRGGYRPLMQGVLGVGEPAVLRRRYRLRSSDSSAMFSTSTARNARRTSRAGTRQDFINGRLKRVAFHSVTTFKPGWGSVWVRFKASFPPSVPPPR